MQEAMKKFILELKSDRKRRRRLGRRVFALSLVVAAAVAWQLRITGITMSDVPCCGMEEHVHGPECIEMVLFCGMEEEEWEEAFPTDPPQPELICQIPEHTHGEACTLVETELICTESHEHGDECYEITSVCVCEEDHEHEESCFEEQQNLICTWEHTHDDSCYQVTETFICTEEEHTHGPDCYAVPELPPQETGHRHSDDCYMSTLVCGYEEEHVHSVECYSDPDADVESPGDWESTLPGLSGQRDRDLISVARSQMGYRESDDNFEVSGDDRMGITRYGQWYGNPYGQWNAMFATFCLRYAGIDDIPGNSGCYAWAAELNQWGILRSPADTPVPGDLVFFDWEGDGAADHVGIVTEVSGYGFRTIEGGRNDCVDSYDYSLGDGSVYGFVRIAEEEEPEPTETTEPTEETTVPTEETIAPTEETTVPTEETTAPTEETTVPTEETTEPTEATTVPTEEITEPTEETTLPTEPESQTIPVTIFEDETCETAVEGAVPMTVSGPFPENVSVRAYPVERELPGREILFAFHIGIYDAQNTLIELGDTTLTMTLPQLLDPEENGTLCRIHPDLLEEPVEAAREGENLTFAITNDAVYALVRPAAEEKPEATSLTVTVYEDASATTPAEEAVPMTVTGVFPEGAVACAYPMETVLEGKTVLLSFHIGVYDAEGSLLEPGEEPMTLAMALPQFLNGDEEFSVYQIHSETPEETVECAMTGGELLFPLTNDAVYALTQPMEIVLPVTIYEDEACTVAMEGAPAMTIIGILPEGCEARAYPVTVTLPEKEVLWAFHIGIFREDGTAFVPTKPLTASVELPQLFAMEDTLLSISQIPPEGEAQSVPAETDGETLTFSIPAPGIYAAAVEALTAESELRDAALNGGAYTMTEDLTVSGESIPVSGDFTLELDGHTLTAETSGPLFTVSEGGSLTVRDSKEENPTQETSSVVMRQSYPDNYGMTASITGKTLTYYVTQSDGYTKTSELCVPYTVTAQGGITATNDQPLIRMSGGSLTLSSGMLYGGSNRAIEMSGGTANLNGGYICGFTLSGEGTMGGAIYADGGALNIPGTVIAGNTASKGGGIYAKGGSITLNGGIVSGNRATGIHGGGIYAEGTEISMSGGYLTNNRQEDGGAYDNGGGGLLLTGGGNLEMNGGCVTGNLSGGGGGGLKFMGANFTMNSGKICANVAEKAEAGGINVDARSRADIVSGCINNNFNSDSPHWGGGGLFVADAAVLNINKVVITENAAGGLGGGVAVCSTGNVHVFGTDGSAIFGNRDMETGKGFHTEVPNWVSAGIKAGIDQELADNTTFLENGHEDLFSALYFYLTGNMLGDGAENWQGTVDGVPTSIAKDEFVQSMRALGMQANPTEADQNAAWSNAAVYITGNYSCTHGGGILCNGSLNIGIPTHTYSNAFFSLSADKTLLGTDGKPPLNADGSTQDIPPYIFELLDDQMKVIETVTCHSSGMILFTSKFEYNKAGQYVYYVREVPPEVPEEGVIYDLAPRRITVTVAQTTDRVTRSADPVQQYTYIIDTVKVEKQIPSGDWTVVQEINTADDPIWDFNPPGLEEGEVLDRTNYRLHLGGDHTKFVNRKFEPQDCKIGIKAAKKYTNSDGANLTIEPGQFQFDLLDSDQLTVLATVSADVSGSVDFSEYFGSFRFEKAGVYTYFVKERVSEDSDGILYDPTFYRIKVEVVDQSVMDQTYLFVNRVDVTVNNGEAPLYSIDLADQLIQNYTVDLHKLNEWGGELPGFTNTKIGTQFSLQGYKHLKNLADQKIDLGDRKFQFDILDQDKKLIETVENGTDGKFVWSSELKAPGVQTYFIREHQPEQVDEIQYDPTVYEVQITSVLNQASATPKLQMTHLKILDQNGKVLCDKDRNENEAIKLPDDQYGENPAFTNKMQDSTSITVVKKWAGALTAGEVSVVLRQNTAIYGETVVLSSDNDWTHTWEDLPLKDGDGNGYTYTVEELNSDSYDVTYSYTNEAGESVGTLLPVDGMPNSENESYLLVSGNWALKLSADGSTENSIPLTYRDDEITVDGVTYDHWYEAASVSTDSLFKSTQEWTFGGYKLTNGSGNLRVVSSENRLGLGKDNIYSGVKMESGQIKLSKFTPPECEWPNGDRKNVWVYLTCDGGYFGISDTPTGASFQFYKQGPMVNMGGGVTVTITNSLKPETPEYNLPETGGVGTTGFTLLGAGIMAAAWSLWIVKRNRKGGKSA